MPSIQVSPETFERIQRMAAERGRTPGELVEELVSSGAKIARSDAEWTETWDRIRADVRSRVPSGMTDEELDAEVDMAIREYRQERARAGRH